MITEVDNAIEYNRKKTYKITQLTNCKQVLFIISERNSIILWTVVVIH